MKFFAMLMVVLLSSSLAWSAKVTINYSVDMAPFKAAAGDLPKLRELRTKVYHDYLKKYFEAYANANKIHLIYTPLLFLQNESAVLIENEQKEIDLMPVSSERMVKRMADYVDNYVKQYEDDGRLALSQDQTQKDETLKQLSEKLAANEVAYEEAKKNLASLQEMSEQMAQRVSKHEVLEHRSTGFLETFEYYRYALAGLIGLGILNLVLTIYFSRRI